jgi:catecholate siderophore receptor
MTQVVCGENHQLSEEQAAVGQKFDSSSAAIQSINCDTSACDAAHYFGGSVLGSALVGMASLVFATGASAQEAAPEAGIALPTIDIFGGDQGYQATQSTITRIPTPLRDTPQTINVVPEKVIQEQRAVTMEDALRNVPGITFSAGEGGQQGDAPFIRGAAARSDMFRDGVRDPGWYTRDLFSSESVEVYKGPSAFAFGRGATGGAINIVSRLPTGVPFIDGGVAISSPKGVRADIDASGKVGNVAGRIVAMGQNVDTPARDNVWTKRWGFAPSVAVDVTDRTKVTLGYIYQDEESVPDYGHRWLPGPTTNPATGARTGGYYGNGQAVSAVPVPRSNWYGVTNGPFPDLVDTKTHILTGKIEHEFNNQLKVSNVTRYISVNRMARPTAPRSLGLAGQLTGAVTEPPAGYPVDQMTIGRQHFQTDTDNTLLLNQTDLVGKFATFGLQHTLAVGAEFARETRWQQRANLCSPTGGAACRTSLWSPDPSPANTGTFTGFGVPNSTTQDTAAVYASDQIKINEYFELLGALRFDRFSTSYNPGGGAPILDKNDNLLSWRVGGVYHPVPYASLYVAYGNSYNPSAEFSTLSDAATGTNNIFLDPEQNKSLEIGAKVDVLGGRLSLTGAWFRTEKTNMRVPVDATTGAAIVLDGLARVQGIELGVAGKLTDKWNVIAGYSYLDSELTRTPLLDQLGNQLPNTPPHNFTLWTTYDVTPEFTVGAGAFYQAKAYANAQNTFYVPDFWRFDAMMSYRIHKNATVQLNVYNITDEMYYAQYYGGHAVPAPGRSATLSLRVRW